MIQIAQERIIGEVLVFNRPSFVIHPVVDPAGPADIEAVDRVRDEIKLRLRRAAAIANQRAFFQRRIHVRQRRRQPGRHPRERELHSDHSAGAGAGTGSGGRPSIALTMPSTIAGVTFTALSENIFSTLARISADVEPTTSLAV